MKKRMKKSKKLNFGIGTQVVSGVGFPPRIVFVMRKSTNKLVKEKIKRGSFLYRNVLD